MTEQNTFFAQRVFTSVAIVLGVTGIAAFLITARQIVLLVFASVLAAVVMSGIIDGVRKVLPLGRGITLVALIFVFVFGFSFLAWMLAPNVIDQVLELGRRLPSAWVGFTEWLRGFNWIDSLFEEAPAARGLLPDNGEIFFNRMLGIFSTVFGILASLLIVFFIAIFLAWEPEAYSENLLRLIGKSKRDRLREVFAFTAHMLRLWMLGKIIAMVVIGTFTGVALRILDVPLALTLGLIAGLCNFIPYFGPFFGFIPIFLITLVEGPRVLLYVAILYTLVQSFESYLMMPLLERKIIRLPPAFVLSAQVFLVLYLGALGLFLATPLIVAGVILVKMLYIDDVLGDRREGDRIP